MTVMIPATSEHKPDYDELDISAKSFWEQTSEDREATFKLLRENRPVSWQRPVEDAVTPDPDDPGYWAVAKHADIVRISRDHKTFVSGQGVLFDLLPDIFLEMSQSFLAMDPPKHDQLRKLVSSAFTPKQIKRIEDQVKVAAREVVDSIQGKSKIEFVSECAEKLPVRMFGDIFGIPNEFRATVAGAAADVVAWADPETLGDRPADEVQVEACATLHEVAEQLVEDRRKHPTEDLLTNLVQAEIDGESLTDFEIGAFFVLMSVAATDTTKHTTSHTMLAFTQFPEQKDWLLEDFDGRIDVALEECIRYASPVMNFRRTAVTETELAGQRIIPGDKVVMFYPSGNWDTDVFTDPDKFDLSRNPNPHVAFGGGGAHFCLGNQLAKSMLRAMFAELLPRVPEFHASNPRYLGTNFMRGIKRMDFEFTAKG